jgi:hypothetical protein
VITLVRDEPGIVEQMALRAEPAAASIDDIELERLLEEAGHASGTVRTKGRVYLAASLVSH